MSTTRRTLIGGWLAAAAETNLLAVFPKRRTVRRYKPDAVPDEHLRQILDAARTGPTCMNQQPWKFMVIRDRAKIAAMKKRTLELTKAPKFTEGYFSAPVYVVVLVDSESPCAGYALKHDGPIAAAYLMLAARALGYGTAYLTGGIPDAVTREVLAIPARYQRICITPVGVPENWPEAPPKRKLEEMVAWETLEGHAPNQPVRYNP